ncbi:putative acyl esterase [Clavibacter sp. B3I6]|nr:putative acyl esterase [Clavibacter sp. B3I6]
MRARTLPLDGPLRLTGDVAVELTSSSDAPGTDWIARLLASSPDGGEQELAVGETTVAGPHDGLRLGVPLGPVAVLLPVGTVLVLELAGADAPRLARNLGGPPGERCTSTTQVPVRQRVALDAATPLTLVLPVAAGTAPTPDGARAGGDAITADPPASSVPRERTGSGSAS